MDSQFKFLVLIELIIVLIILTVKFITYLIERHKVNKLWNSLNTIIKNNKHSLDKDKFKQTIYHLNKINKEGSMKNGN